MSPAAHTIHLVSVLDCAYATANGTSISISSATDCPPALAVLPSQISVAEAESGGQSSFHTSSVGISSQPPSLTSGGNTRVGSSAGPFSQTPSASQKTSIVSASSSLPIGGGPPSRTAISTGVAAGIGVAVTVFLLGLMVAFVFDRRKLRKRETEGDARMTTSRLGAVSPFPCRPPYKQEATSRGTRSREKPVTGDA
ncbi:hypothetical protein K438DRAFT_1839064 [Mycena galopus ATCC 62051]|nr:hypothetical protein K438DRAFT_1839064 [Mycena galopus ATCC 62051]